MNVNTLGSHPAASSIAKALSCSRPKGILNCSHWGGQQSTARCGSTHRHARGERHIDVPEDHLNVLQQPQKADQRRVQRMVILPAEHCHVTDAVLGRQRLIRHQQQEGVVAVPAVHLACLSADELQPLIRRCAPACSSHSLFARCKSTSWHNPHSTVLQVVIMVQCGCMQHLSCKQQEQQEVRCPAQTGPDTGLACHPMPPMSNAPSRASV